MPFFWLLIQGISWYKTDIYINLKQSHFRAIELLAGEHPQFSISKEWIPYLKEHQVVARISLAATCVSHLLTRRQIKRGATNNPLNIFLMT